VPLDLLRGSFIFNTIRHFPEQFLTSWQLTQEANLGNLLAQRPRKIFYAGMGGSALPADLINDYLGNQPLHVVRDYRLPDDAGPSDWVICASFSGNTEETLATFNDSRQRGCPTVILSHGGRLKEIARKENIPFVPIPDCIQPRCATGYFFATCLALLHRSGQIPDQREILEQLQIFLLHRQDHHEKIGKEIAETLADRVPIIYGPGALYGACRIWKIKLNENCKIQSFFNVFPELNHNEMVGFSQLIMEPTIVYLVSQFMDRRIGKRMAVMQEVLGKNIPFLEIPLAGADRLQETFDALALADYASYFLAKKMGIDPTPVEMVEAFKKRLA
jgi:glucose/mannose-6-phosphate isomerase